MGELRINNTDDELTMNLNLFMKKLTAKFTKSRVDPQCQPCTQDSAKTIYRCKVYKKNAIAHQKFLFRAVTVVLISSITCCAIASEERFHRESGSLPISGGRKPDESPEDSYGGANFNSRKDLPSDGRLPDDLYSKDYSTVPEPNLPRELNEDWTMSEYNDSDSIDLKLTVESFDKFWAQLYIGPVCTLVDVRNGPRDLKDLENCTIVDGFVQITFMHETTESSFEGYSFPKLRVITEYLLIYRVYGLRSLKKLFPNLAVIGGRQVFYNYALIIYENPHLQEIGLGNLRRIERGKVRVQRNTQLCYIDKIDWERLGVEETVIADNTLSDDGFCDIPCSRNGSCVDHAGTTTEHCWGRNLCQQKKCPSECPDACEDGVCVCHEECLGGCTQPNNASACRACLHKNYYGECVKECPNDTYLENEWRCISKAACLAMTWVPHEMYYEKEGKVMKKCLYLCPPNHVDAFRTEPPYEAYCKNCNTTCNKVCDKKDGYIVTDVSTAEELNGCTHIPGALAINHLVGDDVIEVLESSLRGLEEVGSLSIRRTESLVSLHFLKSLKRITGKNLIDKRYSLYVINNPNLHQLFPNENSTGPEILQIEKGMAFFHYNPKLCLKEIGLVTALTVGEEDDNDIGTMTNGDRATCDMLPLIITSIEHMPLNTNNLASVRIKWEKVYVSDKRTLIGYQIFYKESKDQSAKRYEGRNVCTQTESGWSIKDALSGPQKLSQSDSEVMEYITAFIHDLKPYTQYALYIMTYTTSSTLKGAQSDITYFTTNPSKPSEPAHLTAYAINSSAIKVEWKPPVNPNGILAHYVVKWRKHDDDEERISKVVDTCKQARKSSTLRNPTLSPTTTLTPKVDKTKENCSCEDTPSLMSLENEAKDNIDFENHLQSKIFSIAPISSPFAGLLRKRRAMDLSQPYNESRNISSDEGYYDDSDYHFMTDVREGSYDTYRNDYTGNTYEATVVKDEEVIITNLSHYTKYDIQVYACNRAAAEGDPKCSYDALIPARTDYRHDVDDIPEESLKVTEREKKDGEMQPALQWEPPVNPNGYVESYEIDIQENLKYEASYASKQLYCYSVYKFNKNMRTFVVPFALAGGPHRARVRAVTLAGKGNWTKFITFDIPQSAAEKARARQQNLEIGIAVGTIFLVIVAIVAIVGYKVIKKRDAKKIVIYSSTNPEYVSVAANYIPDGYDIDLEDIELTKVIGHGNFGKVYMGFARNVIKGQERTKVAIKKLHEKSGIYKRYEFLEEAKLMKAFNAAHVVRLLGVVSQTADPMVIMEYMAQGDLKTYLRSRREDIEIHGDEKFTPPSLQDRLQMAAEIADGMAYLADKKFVHRDLAARNCLVSSEGVVKIGDFGLARDVYETDYYRKDSKGLLPIRWMAPESLRDGVFDVCSDVWSYGVVLWEIATLAEQPYQGRQHDEVTRYVIDGGYMEKPKKCPKKLYDLMLSCWQFHPEMRPKFEEILSSLTNDVTERFKEESYFFEHKRMKFDQMLKFHERTTEEDLYLKCDEHFFKDDACRIVTPLNVTPARSRCETPSGYQTPASRYSNGSVKVGCDMLAHCDHLKRVDVLETKAVTPCAQIPGSKHIVRGNNVNRKRSKGSKIAESFTKRFSGNSTARTNSKSPSKLRKKKIGFFHSASAGSLGSEYQSDSCDSENAVTSQMLPAADNNSNQCDETVNLSSHERHDAVTFPRARINAESYSDTEKPYALMNGFVNRLDSLGRHGSPFRRSNKRTNSTGDESSYVESSPLNSAHYFDTNDFKSTVVEVEAAPPPPSSPPPLPPVGHAL